MNFNRLWAVVNSTTNEVLYSSFDYNRSKSAYDNLVKPLQDEKGQLYPNVGDLFKIRFIRFDINRSYIDDELRVSPFQKSLNEDFRAFMDFCLLKPGKKNNETQTQTNEVKKC